MILLVLFLLLAAPAATDIAQRLARWKPVEMPYHSETLSARERQEVEKLADASRQMEAIYWQQSDPEALELYKTTKDAEAQAPAVHQRREIRSDRRKQAVRGNQADCRRAAIFIPQV